MENGDHVQQYSRKKNDKGIVTLTVNRPIVKNAINLETMHEMRTVIEELEKDITARALIVTGSGDEAFISGGDLKEFHSLVTVQEGRNMGLLMQGIMNRWKRFNSLSSRRSTAARSAAVVRWR
jgi:enoyl-CoA hydratase/carnithine racemase